MHRYCYNHHHHRRRRRRRSFKYLLSPLEIDSKNAVLFQSLSVSIQTLKVIKRFTLIWSQNQMYRFTKPNWAKLVSETRYHV